MAGIWRVLAACSNVAGDLQPAAPLQQFMRCQQLCNSIVQGLHTRHVSTSSSAAATAGAAAATSSSTVSAISPVADGSQHQQHQQDAPPLSSVIIPESSKQLGASHIGLYYNFDSSLVPEAFQPFHQAFYSPRPRKFQRKAGCRGLQAEFSSTNSSSLMWRRSTQELAQALMSGAVQQIHLQGPAGSGKSVAMVQLVEWARNNGWLVLYVPSAAELIRGGFFYKRADGSYDTIISAQHILKSMADSHDKQLQGMKLKLQESKDLLQTPAADAVAGGSKLVSKARDALRDLVNIGLSTDDDGQLAVECCLQLVKELAAASADVPVLLAVDDYNTLFWRTEYGTTVHKSPRGKPTYQYRKELRVNELNLARKFKLLQRSDLGQCRVLVADSSSRRVPDSVNLPKATAAIYHMPRFSVVETAHALFYYHERGLVASPPSEQQVAAMRSLTNGSGKELRKWSLSVTQADMGVL